MLRDARAVEGRSHPERKQPAVFGYDPIFFYPPYGRTLGEATADQKSAVSHRGERSERCGRFLEG